MADTAGRVWEELRKAGIELPAGEVLVTSSGEALCVLSTHGSQAIQLWRRLREVVSLTGYWPVLVGSDEDLDSLRERLELSDFGSTQELIDRGLAIDVAQWLEQKHEVEVDECLEFGIELFSASADESLGSREEFRGLPRGPWPPEQSPSHGFQMPNDRGPGNPLPRVHVALAPTTTCWHVPAYLRFGSWNECPAPEEHVALMRLWQRHFGAEVVGVSRDVVELQAERPPTNKTDALQLAKQQYLYCEDIVVQGTQTLESLAASLLNGTAWFFWWD